MSIAHPSAATFVLGYLHLTGHPHKAMVMTSGIARMQNSKKECKNEARPLEKKGFFFSHGYSSSSHQKFRGHQGEGCSSKCQAPHYYY
jgi:hypothetical protein